MSKMSNVHLMSFANNDANKEKEISMNTFCHEGIEWLKAKEKEDLAAQIEDEDTEPCCSGDILLDMPDGPCKDCKWYKR